MGNEGYILFGAWLLVFVRVVAVFVQAPIWGSHHMPHQVLAGTAAVIAMVVFPGLNIPLNFPTDLIGFSMLVFVQFLVGLVIGYVSFLVMAAVQFAGELLDIQMGLSTAASFDPATKGPSNLLRRYEFYMAMLLYLIFNFHHSMLSAISRSFEVIPLTGLTYEGIMIKNLINLTGHIFYIAVQISAPMLAALFIVQIALGLMSRVAPQMNVFMLSFPLNIIVGFTLLWISLPLISTALHGFFGRNVEDMFKIVQSMGF